MQLIIQKFSIIVGRNKNKQQLSNSNFKIRDSQKVEKLLKNKIKEIVMG